MRKYTAVFLTVIIHFILLNISNADEKATEAAQTIQDKEVSVPVYRLSELVGIAIKKSEGIKQAEEGLYITEREKDRAKAALVPRFTIFGDYTRFSEAKKAATGQILQSDWSDSLGLRFDQSMSLSGREIIAYKTTSKQIKMADYALYSAKEEYSLKVAQAYYGVLKAKKQQEITKANIDRLKKYKDAAEVRLKVGEVTKTALLSAEAQLAAAKTIFIKAKNSVELARASLARIAGIGSNFDINETDTVNEISLGDCLSGNQSALNCLKEKAFAERAEIRSSVINEDIAEDLVKISKGAFYPSLSIEGAYVSRDSSPFNPYAVSETLYGAIRLNFPIFEGGLRKAETLQAISRKRQATLQLEDTRKNISLQVEEAWLDLVGLKEMLESASQQLKFAKDNFNAVSRQFELGLSSNLEVIDANTLLITSESQMVDAELSYQSSILKLLRSTGLLLKTLDLKS